MKKVLRKLRNFFCTFSGEDAYIINQCNPSIQLKFCGIGVFALIIFCGCLLSATSFIAELLEGGMKWISVPIGICWALLITNMYLFLLYTVSPTLLPISKKKKQVPDSIQSHSSQKAALIFRMAFISLLAIIIVQPLNVLLFYHKLSPFSHSSIAKLEKHKTEYKVNMIIASNSALIVEETQLHDDFYRNINFTIKYPGDSLTIANGTRILSEKVTEDAMFLRRSRQLLDTLSKCSDLPIFIRPVKRCDSIRLALEALLANEISSDYSFASDITSINFDNKAIQYEYEKYRSLLIKNINRKINNYNHLEALLGKSNFYVKKIQILLSENVLPWIVTFIGCLAFLLPIYWKFSIRNKGGFYEIKKDIENMLVREQYKEFKIMYTNVFTEGIDEYNQKVWKALIPLLDKLEKVNPSKYKEIKKTLDQELVTEVIEKYEYWLDAPFRTQRRSERHFASEKQLLQIIYSKNS